MTDNEDFVKIIENNKQIGINPLNLTTDCIIDGMKYEEHSVRGYIDILINGLPF